MPGRIRTIKPEILTDEKSASLTHEAWRLWVSMFVLADDAGNLPASPALLSGLAFWAQPADVTRALAELVEAKLVQLYCVKGQTFASITGFARHQKINRPSGGKYPSPVGADPHGGFSEPSMSPHGALSDDSQRDHDRRPSTTTNDHRPGSAEGGNGSPPGPTAPRSKSGPKAESLKNGLAKCSPEELASARTVLGKLSERTGRKYGAPIHLRRVIRLLREGYSEHQVRLVVWDRASEWLDDTRMERYLRPATLFGPEKFPDYLAEAESAWERRRTRQDARGETAPDPSPLVASLMAKSQG